MFLLYYSVVGVPGTPCSSSLLKKFNMFPTVSGTVRVPDLLKNTAARESMAYKKSLSSYDPECQKIHQNTGYSMHYSHYRVKR